MKKTILIIAFIAFISMAVISLQKKKETSLDILEIESKNQLTAIMYKDPNCGCCIGYAQAMRKEGFDVKLVSTKNIQDIKNKYNIPKGRQSCHTIDLSGYFIEGHVPLEAVFKLIKENPDIEGIGLPRMPAGTPGMPGQKHAPYQIYQMKEGDFSNYITI